MDPLSAIASIIAVYELASKVGEMCFVYAQGVRGAQEQSHFLINEIMTFQKSLLTLREMLTDEERCRVDRERLKNLKELTDGDSAYLQQCQRDLAKLLKILENSRTKDTIRTIVYRLSWPLKEEEVNKITRRLRSVATAIDRALNMDNTEMLRGVDATTKSIQISLGNIEDRRKIEEEQRNRDKIFEWLDHPSPQENHDIACRARNVKAKTGRWFLDGDTFKNFKNIPCSLLWLHGESGCGKTVLASAIIEELQVLQNGDPSIGIAYWYYNANDKKRTSLSNLVRALITQFIPEYSVPIALVDFWKAKRKGQEMAKTSELVQTLQSILVERGQRKSYIVIDALDESDDAEREEFLEMLRSILAPENARVHIIVTGRTSTSGIEKELRDLIRFYNVAIEPEEVNVDILAHITERLKNDKILKTWPNKERQKIKTSLVEKAAGMFRWVDCQLQAIRKCKRPADLNKTLNTLPKDVHEQYARELASIPESSSEDALKILQWLTFPQRKLRLEEIVDMIAIDLNEEPPVFDKENRLWDPEGILEICGSLVRVDLNPDGRNSLGEPKHVRYLTAAHATVIDFLKTQSIKISSEPGVRFTRSTINLRMAEACLVYLRYFMDNRIELTEDNIIQYPFARYCAEYWADHYREVIASDEEVDITRINEMVLALFQSPKAMLKWIQLYDPNDYANPTTFRKQLSHVLTSIYYAVLLGLPEIANRLIDEGEKINDVLENSYYGTPLVAASCLGRTDMVSLLLERGADPNLSGSWFWGCPLASAVEQNQEEIVNMLLNHGEVDVNCRRVPSQSEIEITTTADESDIELIKNVSRESMVYIATAYDCPRVLKILLEAGADPNMEGGEYNTALQAACFYGFTWAVKMLIAAGSDINRKGGNHLFALYLACLRQEEEIVELLLEKGADVNIYDDASLYGNSLQAACSCGNTAIAKRLIAAGINVNHKGGFYGSALYAACSQQNEDLVQLLLDSGADPNVQQCRERDFALQQGDRLSIPLQSGPYGTPLGLECFMGNEDHVKLLLENGAKLEEPDMSGQSPLCKAILGSEWAVVDLLIKLGANSNSLDNRGCSYLHYAARARNEEGLKRILRFGSDLNAVDSNGWSPLHWAASSGFESGEAIKTLLKAGSNKDLKDKQGRTALDLATLCGKTEEANILKTDGLAYDDLSYLHRDWGSKHGMQERQIDLINKAEDEDEYENEVEGEDDERMRMMMRMLSLSEMT
ncbi:hypothetical protein MMC07_005219 [Pseudocyphellaria aurata]|nr:hypothetical protein [Pseudocyphellaria aurata]